MDIKKLKEQEQLIRQEIHKEQEEREKELIPKYQKEFIGKCFKYKNSYGSDRPKWWMYCKILDVISINFHNEEESVFKLLEIQSTSNNTIEIKIQDSAYVRNPDFISIKNEEFNKAVKNIMKTIENMLGDNQ